MELMFYPEVILDVFKFTAEYTEGKSKVSGEVWAETIFCFMGQFSLLSIHGSCFCFAWNGLVDSEIKKRDSRKQYQGNMLPYLVCHVRFLSNDHADVHDNSDWCQISARIQREYERNVTHVPSEQLVYMTVFGYSYPILAIFFVFLPTSLLGTKISNLHFQNYD